MALDFSQIKEITIPEGSVKKITYNDITLWEKISDLIKEWLGYPIQTAYSLAGDLLNYKVYGNTKQQLLPAGFTQLEYIESTGTQYIDTAYTKTQVKDVEAQISITQITSIWQIFYGLPDDIQCALDRSGHWVNFGATSTEVISTNTWYNTKLDFTNRTLYIDGNAVAVGNEGTATGGIKIFGNTKYKSYTRMKSVKVHGLNGNLICNMVPAKRNSDNEVGMFDTVSQTFFTNAGTGSFVAGAVAPTPEAPIEIKSVGDKTKNLVDSEHAYNTSGMCVGVTTRWGWIIDLSDVDTYTLRGFFEVASGKGLYYRLSEDNGASWSNSTTISANNKQITISVPSKIVIYGGSSDLSSVAMAKKGVTLVKGATTLTNPIPYGYQIPIVVSGKNLFDKNQSHEDGYYYNDSGVKTSYTSSSYTLPYIEVKPNTKYTVNGDAAFRVYYYDNNKNWISRTTNITSTKTITTPSNCKYIRTQYNNSLAGSGATNLNVVQIEQGSSATSYEPYHKSTTPIYLSNPLRKVGTYSDVLSYDPQQVIRNVGVKVLDGTEDWTLYASTGEYAGLIFSNSIISDNKLNISTLDTLSAHFKAVTTSYLPAGTMRFQMANADTGIVSSHRLYFKRDASDTIETWKAYLASEYAKGTPVIIVYPLATPVTEQLTVPALTMAEGTNLITVDTEISPVDAYARGKVSRL